MILFDEYGRPRTIRANDLVPKVDDFIPELRGIKNLNGRPILPNSLDDANHRREAVTNRNSGFSVVGKKDKLKKKPYKQSCPSMTEEEEKKAILKTKEGLQEKLKEKKEALKKWDKKAKEDVKKWFGDTSDKTKNILSTRIDKMSKLLDSYTIDNFTPMKNPVGTYAQVTPSNNKNIELGYAFCDASEKEKIVTLAHEMSHFDSIGGTNGKKPYTREMYGEQTAKDLAKKDSNYALSNAENYGYYLGS